MPEHVHDKGYKRMLSKRKNFLHFLKKYIQLGWVDGLAEDDLQLVDKSFIDDDFKERESDIVYRIHNGEIDVVFYIILELQSRVDYTMPFRLLVYMTELLKRIFRDTPKKERERKGFRLPAVIPIVLYNGGEPWSAVQSLREYTAGAGQFEKLLDFTYDTVDLGRESDQHILSTNTLLDNVFYLEKSDNAEAARRILPRIIHRVSQLSPEDRQELMEWLHDVLLQLVPHDTIVNEVLSTFRKGDENEMESALVRVFREEQQKFKQEGRLEGRLEGRQEGRQEGIQNRTKEIALKMLRRGMPIPDIQEITELSKEELEKWKQEM